MTHAATQMTGMIAAVQSAVVDSCLNGPDTDVVDVVAAGIAPENDARHHPGINVVSVLPIGRDFCAVRQTD